MKVLQIDVNYGQGSTGRIAQTLVQGLRARGHEATACFGRGPKVSEEGIYKFGIDFETYAHAVFTRITGYTGRYSPCSTMRLIKYIKQYNPDIIHIHELHAYFVSLSPLLNFIKQLGIPVVWTFHCEFMYTGKCGHADDCDEWQHKCGHCPKMHDYVSTICFDKTSEMLEEKKRLLKNLNLTIVTPSQWLADRVGLSFLSDKPIYVIHNGIDTNVFRPTQAEYLRNILGIPNENKVVLALAPKLMSDNKVGMRVLDFASRMSRNAITFLMVGVENVSSWKSTDNVIMLPPTSNLNLLAKLYSLADIFLIFSKKENYPTTCLEAQACGTPVLGFDVGGVKESIQHGLVVPYGDMKAAQQSLFSLFNSKPFDPFLDNLGNEDMVNAYLSLYEQVLEQNRKA